MKKYKYDHVAHYAKNKEVILAKKKAHYKASQEYRAEALRRSAVRARILRVTKLTELPPKYVYMQEQVLTLLGITWSRLAWWRKLGYVPDPLKYERRRMFTETQLHALEFLRDVIDGGGSGLKEAVEKIHKEWGNDGYHNQQ